MDDQRHHHYHDYHHFRQLWAISGLAVREGVAQLEGIAVGDDDDVSTSRVLGDDMLDIDIVQRSGLHHAGERDQREQRVVIAGASELAKLG